MGSVLCIMYFVCGGVLSAVAQMYIGTDSSIRRILYGIECVRGYDGMRCTVQYSTYVASQLWRPRMVGEREREKGVQLTDRGTRCMYT